MQDAVEITKRAIETLASRHRKQVILFVVVTFASVLGALGSLSWKPLLALFALVPLSALFVCLDIALLGKWQRQLLHQWIEDRLDLDAFTQSISTIRMLPPITLRGMLGALPTQHVLGKPAAHVSRLNREAVAANVAVLYRCQIDRTALTGLAYLLILTSVGVALFFQNWIPLAGCLLALPVLGMIRVLGSLRLRRWQAYVERIPAASRCELLDIAHRLGG